MSDELGYHNQHSKAIIGHPVIIETTEDVEGVVTLLPNTEGSILNYLKNGGVNHIVFDKAYRCDNITVEYNGLKASIGFKFDSELRTDVNTKKIYLLAYDHKKQHFNLY